MVPPSPPGHRMYFTWGGERYLPKKFKLIKYAESSDLVIVEDLEIF